MKLPEKHITNLNYPIRLGQFLKLVNVAQDGQEAKVIIQEGQVKVNNRVDKRRGKQLLLGDVVEVQNNCKYILQ